MDQVKELRIGNASDSTPCDAEEAAGPRTSKPRGAYSAPKLERLGSVANVALFSGGGTTFF